ncbi:MAG: hypothetical protein KC486_22020 [Myxococcales bacterium]|nr:hypothetical protein [Myxococcales bacterium]
MWRPHPDSNAFLDALADLEAPARYYALVDAPATADEAEALEELLEREGLRAAWFRRERFWRHVREDGDRTWWLHLAASGGRLELGLYLRTPRGDLGGPAHSLVLKAARRRSRGFTREPPYPRLPLTTGSVRFARWLLEAMASAAGERFDAR